MAVAQLQLIESERSWKLDRRTVEIGRAGVARARAALAAATAPPVEEAVIEPVRMADPAEVAHQAAA